MAVIQPMYIWHSQVCWCGWQLISPFLDSVTRSKIVFIDAASENDRQSYLAKYVPASTVAACTIDASNIDTSAFARRMQELDDDRKESYNAFCKACQKELWPRWVGPSWAMVGPINRDFTWPILHWRQYKRHLWIIAHLPCGLHAWGARAILGWCWRGLVVNEPHLEGVLTIYQSESLVSHIDIKPDVWFHHLFAFKESFSCQWATGPFVLLRKT